MKKKILSHKKKEKREKNQVHHVSLFHNETVDKILLNDKIKVSLSNCKQFNKLKYIYIGLKNWGVLGGCCVKILTSRNIYFLPDFNFFSS